MLTLRRFWNNFHRMCKETYIRDRKHRSENARMKAYPVTICPVCGQPMNTHDYGKKVWREVYGDSK